MVHPDKELDFLFFAFDWSIPAFGAKILSADAITNRKITENEMTVSHDICVYVRGLKNST